METEIENWIQKYDSEMSEKQVFVCLILSQVCFPRSSRNHGEGAGEEKPSMVHGLCPVLGLPRVTSLSLP